MKRTKPKKDKNSKLYFETDETYPTVHGRNRRPYKEINETLIKRFLKKDIKKNENKQLPARFRQIKSPPFVRTLGVTMINPLHGTILRNTTVLTEKKGKNEVSISARKLKKKIKKISYLHRFEYTDET